MKDIDNGYRAAMKAMRDMAKGRHVVAGIRGEKGAQRHPPADGEDGAGSDLSIVEIAAVNEFGTDDGHIPSRPAFRATFDKNRSKYERAIKIGVGHILDGNSTLDVEFGRLGLRMASDIQSAISEGIAPENAPSTIARKGSEKPLIASGRTRQSIDSEVRAKRSGRGT